MKKLLTKFLSSSILALLSLNIMQAQIQVEQEDITKHNWIAKINDIVINDSLKKNTKSGMLQCTLSMQERKKAKLYYPVSLYDYHNAIINLNRANDINGISKNRWQDKYTKENLAYKFHTKNALEKLLAIQIAFSKDCKECLEIRELINAEYFAYDIQRILNREGGNFYTSYAFAGEAFLCQGLEREDSKDLLMAYANFMLAGLHTRALNALMASIALNSTIAFDTFRFLATFDHVMTKNNIGAYYLGMLRLENKQSNFFILTSLPHFQNLRVLEYGVESNYGLQILLMQDMKKEYIVLPFDKFTTRQTLKEFRQRAQFFMRSIHKNNQDGLLQAQVEDLKEYYKILQFKQKLKHIEHYPYTLNYIIPHAF